MMLIDHGKSMRGTIMKGLNQSEYHLSEVTHVKQVEGIKQVTFLHAEHVAAAHQKGANVLQAQKLGR